MEPPTSDPELADPELAEPSWRTHVRPGSWEGPGRGPGVVVTPLGCVDSERAVAAADAFVDPAEVADARELRRVRIGGALVAAMSVAVLLWLPDADRVAGSTRVEQARAVQPSASQPSLDATAWRQQAAALGAQTAQVWHQWAQSLGLGSESRVEDEAVGPVEQALPAAAPVAVEKTVAPTGEGRDALPGNNEG